MSISAPFAGRPELAAYFQDADTWDVKVAEGARSLEAFLAAFFSHAPAWLRAGVVVRQAVARITGIDLPPLVTGKTFAPQDIPFVPGAAFEFFTVLAARPGEYWVAQAGDRHIRAVMLVVREPLDGPRARFSVATAVRFLSLRGRAYYALILPAHHLGLAALTRAGAG